PGGALGRGADEPRNTTGSAADGSASWLARCYRKERLLPRDRAGLDHGPCDRVQRGASPLARGWRFRPVLPDQLIRDVRVCGGGLGPAILRHPRGRAGPPEAERCLRNIARLVRPGGHLFISGTDLDVREKVAHELGWR